MIRTYRLFLHLRFFFHCRFNWAENILDWLFS